jgi:hypothetical protein
MPAGNLSIYISTLEDEPAPGVVHLEFKRFTNSLGAGGSNVEVSLEPGSTKDFEITGIPCIGGPGTMYTVSASLRGYRLYCFHQRIRENTTMTASDDVAFWVKPGSVIDIQAPAYEAIHDRLKIMLRDATMIGEKKEDRDLVGLRGAELYDALGPLRKACLLNIGKKAMHPSSERVLRLAQSLLICRQDRCFAMVDETMPQVLRASERFHTAPATLHHPPKGFTLTGDSFKSRDAHANLQATFLRETSTGKLAADIDIDESSGIGHGFEVIRNATFQQRTNPYLIREFLLAAGPELTFDPGYRFVIS